MSSPLATPQPWDLVAEDYTTEVVPQIGRYSADALTLAAVPPGARVLDVACGPGTLALQIAGLAAHVDAIDFSPRMIAQLEARIAAAGLSNVTARQGDGQALPYADASFDAAFSMFGLMFFPDRARGLAELRRVLSPGGVAVIGSWEPLDAVPALATALGVLAQHMPGPQPPVARALATPEDVRAELEAAGFTQVRVERSLHAVETTSTAELWAGFQRTLAPVALMRKRLGPEAWAPIAAAAEAALTERLGPGPQRVAMPALLGLGRAPH